MNRNPFAICLQRFFTDHLTIGLRASVHTIASYRDTFRLLLNYASEQLSSISASFVNRHGLK